jgi:hypothetical protein
MTIKQIKRLLAANGQRLQSGYNYVAFSVALPEAKVAETVALLRRKKVHVEREYRKATGERLALLPCVCLPRRRSVLLPLPLDVRLNVVSAIVLELPGIDPQAEVPVWS